MNRTKIEWTDFTWNPITGCLHGCPFCYAETIARRFAGRTYPPYPDHFKPTFHPERLDQPLRRKKPTKIFVVDMGDMFGAWVPDSWIAAILNTIEQADWHTFQLLTKRPDLMMPWSPFPENCWCGTTVTKEREAYKIDQILEVEAPVRFISFEPLHGPVDHPLMGLQWIIIGEETGNRKGKIETLDVWVDCLVARAQGLEIPVFIKPPLYDRYWLKLQEFPK